MKREDPLDSDSIGCLPDRKRRSETVFPDADDIAFERLFPFPIAFPDHRPDLDSITGVKFLNIFSV
jgi:hypothetical protein